MIKFILIVGFILNFLAYGNLYSTLVFFVFFYFSRFIINLFVKSQDYNDTNITSWLFSLVYLFSAVSEILFNHIGSSAMPPDALRFYQYASDPNWDINNFGTEYISGFETDSLIGLKEDFMAILFWNKLYKLVSYFGIPEGRYIGTSINTVFLAWTSSIGLSIIRSIKYLNNKKTKDFYKLLYCSNGLFWMYGAIHLRESIILFCVSILLKVWVNWINKKSFFNLIIVGIISIIYYLSAEYLRGGYSYITFAFIFSFLLVNIVENFINKKVYKYQLITYILIVLGFVLAFNSIGTLYEAFSGVFDTYYKVSLAESNSGSLGMVLLNLPLPLRSIGSIFYLLIMPIPLWGGQEYTFSLYFFFKGCFALFNYLTIPILILIIKDNLNNYKNLNSVQLFLFFSFVLSLLIIGLTTLDQRHSGNFSLIYILLLCFFKMDSRSKIVEYKSLLKYVLIGVYLLYFAYMTYMFRSIFVLLSFSILPLASLYVSRKKIN